MSVLLHNPRCRKSREALDLLNEKGEMVQIVEYLKTPLAKEELEEVLEKLGKKPSEVVRRGEAIFKENYKGKELAEQDYLDMMIEHPKLMERPIFIKEDKAVVGRPPEEVLKLV